jgi:transcriptional regulator with XRE-family HTH domain
LKPKDTDFEPKTLGEHVRRRRFELKLSQAQAASQLRVSISTMLNWERGHTKPPIAASPAILTFLGYNPFPVPKNLAEQLLAKRQAMGWSIKVAARQLGVDEGTWAAWENGSTPWKRYAQRLEGLLT